MEKANMSQSVTRREFLGTSGKTAAGAAVAMGLAGCATTGQQAAVVPRRKYGPNERFTIALIGCGGMGRFKLCYHNNFLGSKQCDVAMVCDIDPSQTAAAVAWAEKDHKQKPKQVKDYREVIDNKDIDIVIVATPDHWHATPMMAAVAADKDVYCEKPCCHNIMEGKAMVDAAQKYNRVVQVGTHQRSIPQIAEARKWIQDGGLGIISQTNTFTYGNDSPDGLGHDPDEPAPKGVDYNTWLGPAPVRPFNHRRFHSKWRWYFDYGCGMVGDWNVHLQDIIMWTMGVTAPIAVSSAGGKLVLTDDRDTPDTMQSVYEFGPCKLAPKGFTQTYTMRKASGRPWNADGYGMVFHGTNGKGHLDRKRFNTEADKVNWADGKSGDRMENIAKEDGGGDLLGHAAHVANFLDCVRTGKTPTASIELHYNTVVACHLANVSLKVGRKIFWDADKVACFKDRALTIPDREANKLLAREYRKGFELPDVL